MNAAEKLPPFHLAFAVEDLDAIRGRARVERARGHEQPPQPPVGDAFDGADEGRAPVAPRPLEGEDVDVPEHLSRGLRRGPRGEEQQQGSEASRSAGRVGHAASLPSRGAGAPPLATSRAVSDRLLVRCFACSAAVALASGERVGFRDACEGCGADLHVCRNCAHHDPSAYNECREPGTERVSDRERANRCEWFAPGAGGDAGVADAKARAGDALDALFKKS